MPLTTAFIKETLRLANIVDMIIPRVVSVDIKLPNREIMQKGTEWGVDVQRMWQVLIPYHVIYEIFEGFQQHLPT